ncbi:hypothetical protein CRG98_039141 [Punica granatum]|uniref:Uncharacterized protein n=1 Tax=Punica granatum TaxID=22663 RepID=A0A2I0I917_PUNGR|nr:hypothetical protein CRG98_039141 [Punica granatum]
MGGRLGHSRATYPWARSPEPPDGSDGEGEVAERALRFAPHPIFLYCEPNGGPLPVVKNRGGKSLILISCPNFDCKWGREGMMMTMSFGGGGGEERRRRSVGGGEWSEDNVVLGREKEKMANDGGFINNQATPSLIGVTGDLNGHRRPQLGISDCQ